MIKNFLIALTFLTRIPISIKGDYQQDDFPNSIYYFPIIGLLVGGVVFGSYYLLNMFLPPQVSAALLLLIYVVLTGGLHLDGLIDSVDGIYGGMTRERRLEIMKDTNPGAFGVLGAVLILLLKYSIYMQLDQGLLVYLVVASVIGRQSMVWVMTFFPYARKEGLGKMFGVCNNYRLFGITTGITLIVVFLLAQIKGIIILLLAAIFCFLLACQISRLLGGLTGDSYGAVCELAEVFVLLFAIIII